jgi:pimeloyl-ACP methyl ester carboxylesterase
MRLKFGGSFNSIIVSHYQRHVGSSNTAAVFRRSVLSFQLHQTNDFTTHSHVKAYSDSYSIKTLDVPDVDKTLKKVYYIDEQPKESSSSLPPIVIIGGTSQTINSYLPHIQSIRKKRRLIIIELRGQGQTELDSKHCTMPQLVHDLKTVFHNLQLSPQGLIHLSGFSFGGRVALAFAAFHPEYVGKLSITGVPLVRPNLGKMILQSWEDALKRGNMRECAWSFLINGYSDLFINKHYSRLLSFIEIIIAANQKDRLYDLIRLSSVANENDPYSIQSTASKILCPTQLIVGKGDRIAGFEPCLDLKKNIPQAEIEMMDCGHLMPFEEPVHWRNHLLKFFS